MRLTARAGRGYRPRQRAGTGKLTAALRGPGREAVAVDPSVKLLASSAVPYLIRES